MLTNVKDQFGNIIQINLDESDYMTSDDLISWYMTHVNHNITNTFLSYLNDLGILESKYSLVDTNESLYSLDKLNSIMLERINENYVKTDNGDYKMKDNRHYIVDKFKKTSVVEKPIIEEVKETVKTETQTIQKPIIKSTNTKSKFKIEYIGGNKMKLHKIK